jgi:hypothetical protein
VTAGGGAVGVPPRQWVADGRGRRGETMEPGGGEEGEAVALTQRSSREEDEACGVVWPFLISIQLCPRRESDENIISTV